MSPLPERQRRCLDLSWHQRKLLSNLCAHNFMSMPPNILCKAFESKGFRMVLLDTRNWYEGIKVALVEPEIISLDPLTISYYSYNRHEIVTKTFNANNKDLLLKELV